MELAAWSTGFVLENVRLKVEAFDYLQLPFVITEGCIGRLEVQARSCSKPALFQGSCPGTCRCPLHGDTSKLTAAFCDR